MARTRLRLDQAWTKTHKRQHERAAKLGTTEQVSNTTRVYPPADVKRRL
jgi:hypothetical protein